MFKEPGVFRLILAPFSQDLFIAHQNRVIIVGQSLIIPVNNFFKQGKLVFDLQKLIHLLLTFNDGEPGLGIFGNDFYLPGE